MKIYQFQNISSEIFLKPDVQEKILFEFRYFPNKTGFSVYYCQLAMEDVSDVLVLEELKLERLVIVDRANWLGSSTNFKGSAQNCFVLC